MDEAEKLECARQQAVRLGQAMAWAESRRDAMIILDEAVDSCDPQTIREAFARTVPTYHDPSVVNSHAAEAAEMQMV